MRRSDAITKIDPRLVTLFDLKRDIQYREPKTPASIFNCLVTNVGEIANYLDVALSTIYNWKARPESISFEHYRKLYRLYNAEMLVRQAMLVQALPLIQDAVFKSWGEPPKMPEPPENEADFGDYELAHGHWEMVMSEYEGWVWDEVQGYFEERGVSPDQVLTHQFESLLHLPASNLDADRYVSAFVGTQTITEIEREMDAMMLAELGATPSEEAKDAWLERYFSTRHADRATAVIP
jgi:hypothetical protein